MRINKFLSEAGICSRRKADELILAGKVTRNGQIIKELGIQVDPKIDKITVDGQICQLHTKTVYYALYKPKGVVSTSSDEKGRESVIDLVPPIPKVYPIGRLDMYSEGLMILTNDGELTQKLTHPSFEHDKEYEVIVNPEQWVRSQDIKEKFEKGLLIENVLMKAFDVKISTSTHDSRCITIKLVLRTGYNRQIRKMCDKIGLKVLALKRIRIGKLKLVDLHLKPGEYKEIRKTDIV